jgi:hypothetical protein
LARDDHASRVCMEGEPPVPKLCYGDLQLADASGGLTVFVAAGSAPPGCSLDCEPSGDGVRCRPLHAGVTYVAWGQAGPDEGAAADEIWIEGYCLATTTQALRGRYMATWTLAEATVGLDVTIELDSLGALTWYGNDARCEGACDGLGVTLAGVAGPVVPGDGVVTLVHPQGAPWWPSVLYAREDRLAGRLEGSLTGRVELVRLPPEVPCDAHR